MELNTALAKKGMASGYTARRWEKNKRIAIHHTCVFSVVGTWILCALDEESTPVPSYLPCDADVQAHSGRYCLKSGIAPAVSGCLIPHRLLPRCSPGRRGDWRCGLTAPPCPIPVHRLPLADSLAWCLLSVPELGRYVRLSIFSLDLKFASSVGWWMEIWVGIYGCRGGFALDLGDFGLWPWICSRGGW